MMSPTFYEITQIDYRPYEKRRAYLPVGHNQLACGRFTDFGDFRDSICIEKSHGLIKATGQFHAPPGSWAEIGIKMTGHKRNGIPGGEWCRIKVSIVDAPFTTVVQPTVTFRK